MFNDVLNWTLNHDKMDKLIKQSYQDRDLNRSSLIEEASSQDEERFRHHYENN